MTPSISHSLLKIILSVFFGFIYFGCGYAQEYSFDKLKPVIDELIAEDIDSAFVLSERLEEDAIKRGDSSDLMEAYNYLGFINIVKGRFYLAQDFLKKAIDLRKRIASPCATAITYASLGRAYHKTHDYDDAIAYYIKAIETPSSDADYECVYSPMINLTKLYLDLEKYDKAKEMIRKTIPVLAHIEDTLAKYRYQNLQGLYYLGVDKMDSATYYFNKFLDYGLKFGTQNDLANAHNNLAIVYFNTGDYGKSKYNFEKAFEVRQRQGDTSKIMESLLNLGFYHQSLNHPKEALLYYTEGLKLAKATHSIFDLRDFYAALLDVYKMLGDKDKIIEMYAKYMDYFQQALKKANDNRIEELSAKYRYQQQKQEIELTKENNAKLQALNAQITEEKNHVKRQNYVLLGLLVLLLLSAGLIYVFLNKNKKLETDLEITTLDSEEKTTLIKEIHHRVKNNLQIITSLLRLQASTIDDDSVANHFLDCQQRVSAMALVHEKLYMSSDLSAVNLPEYVNELIRNLVASYATGQRVTVKTNLEIERLELDTVIPLSLIINETVTNSFKHGKASHQKDDFTIVCEMTLKDNRITMIIGDNGVGFPEGFSLKNNGTLGTELIDTLIEQIDGEVEILSDRKGAFYRIIFPLE